jgi:hypothetical protein
MITRNVALFAAAPLRTSRSTLTHAVGLRLDYVRNALNRFDGNSARMPKDGYVCISSDATYDDVSWLIGRARPSMKNWQHIRRGRLRR